MCVNTVTFKSKCSALGFSKLYRVFARNSPPPDGGKLMLLKTGLRGYTARYLDHTAMATRVIISYYGSSTYLCS
jgi:hypothetical protein